MAYLVRDNSQGADVTWNYTNVAIWTLPECAVAIILACLSSLRPILRLLTGHAVHTRSNNPISKPASGTTPIHLPNGDAGQHTLEHGENHRKNSKNDENKPQKLLPDRPHTGGDAAPGNTHSVMSQSHDLETDHWHNDNLSPKIAYETELVQQRKQAHNRIESPTWYDDTDDSKSLEGLEDADHVLGQARRKNERLL